jgi:hypothetical protein
MSGARKPAKTEVLQVRCEPELIDLINAARRLESDPPSKAEMVRVLVAEALDARHTKARQAMLASAEPLGNA